MTGANPWAAPAFDQDPIWIDNAARAEFVAALRPFRLANFFTAQRCFLSLKSAEDDSIIESLRSAAFAMERASSQLPSSFAHAEPISDSKPFIDMGVHSTANIGASLRFREETERTWTTNNRPSGTEP
jgi:hypothetical protein